MKNGVLHKTCPEFYDTHGRACKTCPDRERCNQAGFKPPSVEIDEDLAVVIDLAEGEGYEVCAVGGTAGHFVLT